MDNNRLQFFLKKFSSRIALLLLAVFSQMISFAQHVNDTAPGDVMRNNGKIYVVMAVCLTILAGFIFYAIRIDRKIKKLEDGK